MPYFSPIKFSRFEVGDLVAIVIGQTQYVHGKGAQAYLECHVGEVFSVGEYGRLKAVRFAVDGSVVRRKDLHRLVGLNPSPASRIDVPAAMAAARAHGEPFKSLEALRDAIRPFRLDAPHDPASCTECADQHEAEQVADRSFAVESGTYTDAQLDGTACCHCGRDFAVGEASEPLDDLVNGHQLFAHADICGEVTK